MIQPAFEASSSVLRLIDNAQQVLDAIGDVLRENDELRTLVAPLQQEREYLQEQSAQLAQQYQDEVNQRLQMERESGALLAELRDLVARVKPATALKGDSSAPCSSACGAELIAELRAILTEIAPPARPLDPAERLRALSEFSEALSHDLNNTLTGILVRVQMLTGSVSDGSVRRQLRMIEHVASDGAWIVKRLQDFSRSRPNRPFEPIDLNRLVEEVALLAQSSWGQTGSAKTLSTATPSQEVVVEPTPIPPILGDIAELRDAATSIVLRAIDAMPAGGRLTFRTGAHQEHVFCAIAHTGLPLSEDERLRLFDPVFGVMREKGNVRDLSRAYATVRRHSGQVVVSSDGERGAEFTLSLPITAVVGPPAEPEPQLPAGADPVHEARPRILVIDDSSEVRDVLSDLLAQHGYAVKVTEDGESGLAEAEQQSFVLAMVDIGLPGISGIEAAARIKLRWPNTFLVLMTGYADRVGINETRAKSIDAVLTKPFSLDQVKALVEQALARAGAGARDTANDLIVPGSH